MSQSTRHPVIEQLRLALRRGQDPAPDAPTPPVIDESAARLVHIDLGLPELFATRASANGMRVAALHVEQLLDQLVDSLRAQACRRIAVCESKLMRNLGVLAALQGAGFDARLASELTLAELYATDAAVTDVYCAVAEVGALVVRAPEHHGRGVSLIPPVHVAILEPANFIADLLDLMAKLAQPPAASATTLITGPSKTADIEMTIVTGVHGPRLVQAFILQ